MRLRKIRVSVTELLLVKMVQVPATPFQFSVLLVHLRKQEVMVQVLGSPYTSVIQMKFSAPGFGFGLELWCIFGGGGCGISAWKNSICLLLSSMLFQTKIN